MLYDSSLWLRAIKALQLLLAVHGEITEERTVNFGCEAEKPVLNIKHYYTWDGLPASACTFCLNSQWMRDSKALSDCKALDSSPHPHNSTMHLSRLHEVTGFYERSLRPGDGERYAYLKLALSDGRLKFN